MAGSSSALDVARAEDLKYVHASHVNVSNFVSVKLSSQSNYPIWKAQMLCLIESQMLSGVIDTSFPMPGGMIMDKNKRYDTLVKGWIFGSIDENVLKNFVHIKSARQVWRELESNYTPLSIDSTTDVPSPGFMFKTEFVRVPEIASTENLTRKIKLYEATVEGRWWKTKSLLKNHKDAATKAISENGNTMLHLAIEMGHDYFVEQLLIFLEDGKDVEKKNIDGRTPLHIAAMVDNKYAAQLLIQKRENLLWILDYKAQSPLDIAYNNMKLNTYAYLLKVMQRPSRLSSYPQAYHQNAIKLIVTAILTKQYDLASVLLKKYPDFVMKNDQILMTIAKTFPTEPGFIEYFVYPSLNNVQQRIFKRGSLLFHCDDFYNCVEDVLQVVKSRKNVCYSWLRNIFMILLVPVIATLYPIYVLTCLLILVLRFPFSMFYFLMWKVLAIILSPVKNIEKKKKEYNEAKEILSLICDQMGTSRSSYNGPILEAVRQDAYQVVDEILYCAPDTINCKDGEGHNVIQLAIINRSEKVYNLICHIVERMETFRTMKDSSMNNLVHLAGRLAPSFVLGRTTGATLQLQRELQWRKEVENLMSPLELKEHNMHMETPEMLFEREHADLMKQGENWTKTTAESCSITAALIVTVVFAAAITVPGGNNQESGIPLFKKQSAFTIFAIANAFSLFTAATALLLFLSILTTRFSEKEFLISLPRRLIFGLFTLFLSTTSMVVAFGAISFLVFCDHRPYMLAPIVLFACFPILVIVSIKLPLMAALFLSTYFPIFGRPSYIDNCKSNRKNTIFFGERINGHLEGRLLS